MNIEEKFFRLLRFSIGTAADSPAIDGGEWAAIYALSRKHSLLGVVFDGVSRMPDGCRPPRELTLKWFAECRRIEKLNTMVDDNVAGLTAAMARHGFRTCILKGQGNALMYPDPRRRIPGDIDVWLEGTPRDIISFVKRVRPDSTLCYHHADFPPYKGTEVEVHYRPCFMQNMLYNRRLQHWFTRMAAEQFANEVTIGGRPVAVPTPVFNAVYQLTHIYNHLFNEGIGLRQLLDYHYVMMAFGRGLSDDGRSAFASTIRHLGLYGFAGAVMYVLREVFATPAEALPVPADVRRGRFVLAEVLAGGNFGQYDERYGFGRGAVGHNLQRLHRDARMFRYFPAESIGEPIFRLWHFFWRVKNER